MKYLAAYLLAQTAGTEEPSAADITGILTSVGIEVDKAQLKKVVDALAGKNVEELIAEGSKKLASMPSAGAAPAASSAAPAAAAGGAAKKEEKKEEAKEESDEDMGFGLFD